MRTSIITPGAGSDPVSFAAYRLTDRKVKRKSYDRYCWPGSFVAVGAESAAQLGRKCGCNDSIATVRKTTASAGGHLLTTKTNNQKNINGNYQPEKNSTISFIAALSFIVLQLGLVVMNIMQRDGGESEKNTK